MRNEFFGNDQQRAILRRGRGMAALLQQDARYSYYGRTVGLVGPEDGDIDQLATLAMVQGNTNYGAVPSSQVDAVKAGMQARGLVPMRYDKWEGTGSAIVAAQDVISTTSLPEDLTLVRLEASTPDQLMVSMAQMALDCGVLPLCGAVCTGLPYVWLPLTARQMWLPARRLAHSHTRNTPDTANRHGGGCWQPIPIGVVIGCRSSLAPMSCSRWRTALDFGRS